MAGADGRLEALGSRARSALSGFAALVARLRTRVGVLPLPELLDAVLEESGYRAMLADGSEEGEERWANLLELRSVTTRYDDLTPDDALDRFLEETALVADQDSYEAGADAVTLITLHAAKGLEFPVVFIAGLEEGVFPHSRSLDDEKQLEEERRLAYVGITRAKRRLFLSHAARRATWGRAGCRCRAASCSRSPRPSWRGRGWSGPTTSTTTSATWIRPGLRAASEQPIRHADPGRRWRVPAWQRPARRAPGQGGVPARRATSARDARPTSPGRAPAA